MERPPRRPSAARPRPRSLQRAAAALFLAILVALPFAVLYRGPVSRSLHDSWEWDPLPSLDASEEDGAARDDDLVILPPPFLLMAFVWFPIFSVTALELE
jgi:hypothetical protein